MKKIIASLFLMSRLCAHEQADQTAQATHDMPMQEVVELCPTAQTSACKDQPKEIDKTQEYKNKKAHEAIIHDTYDEAMKLEDVPSSYINLIKQFDLKPEDINFYTAVRMNRFVEKVGNNIMLLHPNFFLYLTEQEQLAYIAIQLARIKAGDNPELGGKHDPAKRTLKRVKDCSVVAIGLFLAGMYHKEIMHAVQEYWPAVKEVIFSKTGAVIGGIVLLNMLLRAQYERAKLKTFLQRELESTDVVGAEGLITIREKQVHWGKNKASWLEYQWGKLMGNLYLDMNPEVELERIKNHVAHRNA